MITNGPQDFVFIAIPRTASRAMAHALMTLPQSQHIGHNHHSSDRPPDIHGRRVFAGVRNPYAREYSHYLYRCKNTPSSSLKKEVQSLTFYEYVKRHACGKYGDPPITKVMDGIYFHPIRFEDLPTSFISNFPKAHLPHINTTGAFATWKRAYTSKIATIVHNHFELDFSTYGYFPASWKT